MAPQKWAAWRTKFDVKEINVADSNDHIAELSALFDPIVVVGPEAVGLNFEYPNLKLLFPLTYATGILVISVFSSNSQVGPCPHFTHT